MLCDRTGFSAVGECYVEKMALGFFNCVVYALNFQYCFFPLVSEWYICKHPLAS